MTLTLHPGATPLSVLHDIWATGATPCLDEAARPGIEAAAALVAQAAARDTVVYGVHTGFGTLASG